MSRKRKAQHRAPAGLRVTTVIEHHESSAQVRQQVNARLARAAAAGYLDPAVTAGAHVILPLGRHGAPGSREDFTCDVCGAYARGELVLGVLVGTLTGGTPCSVPFGLCRRCAAAEMGEDALARHLREEARTR